MASTSALEILSRPLLLTEIEEVQVCLGHKSFFNEYKNYNKAKESGLSWKSDARKNPVFKAASFIINELNRKRYKLYCYFEHVNDAKCCDNYRTEVIRKTCDLVVKEIIEKIPHQKN
ncbi:MAG: hypothetical protein S4CHLAM6_09800 [Chlamydiae bacterium]|nr:hypothetical protein [Chlamydiota bacterium]